MRHDHETLEDLFDPILRALRSRRALGRRLLLKLDRKLSGIASATPLQRGLERVVARTNAYLDLAEWRARLGEIEGQVCRVEVGKGPSKTFGTGFLVGPDLVITNQHVLAPAIAGAVPRSDVTLRFDFKALATGGVVSPGTEIALANDWLVDHSPPSPMDVGNGDPDPSELDYAVVRVQGAPGDRPAGDDAEPNAPARRWIVPAASASFEAHAPLYIVQHPKGDPIKLALDTGAILGLNGNGTRIRYRTNTDPGSSGAPCFDQRWGLIAMHHAGDPDFSFGHAAAFNQGIPFSRIVTHLARPGVGVVLPPLPK